MVQAAAMLTGLWVLFVLWVGDWSAPALSIAAPIAALACVLAAWRLGVFRGGDGPYAHAVSLMLMAIGRAGGVVRGSVATMRAAISADVNLKPALVRVRMRPSSESARAALVDFIGAAPGAVIVDVDEAGLLAHVTDEDTADAQMLARVEAGAVAAVDGRRAAGP